MLSALFKRYKLNNVFTCITMHKRVIINVIYGGKMQDFSSLEDDFLEIEQTLSAVRHSLKQNNKNSETTPNRLKTKNISLVKNSTFRGINSAKQKPQKSTILRRDLISKSKKTVVKQAINSVPNRQVLPNLSVIKAKLSLKSTNAILKNKEELNKQKTYLNKNPNLTINRRTILSKKDGGSSDSTNLVVKRASVRKNSKLISSNKDKAQLQKLKTKILLNTSKHQNFSEENNFTIKTKNLVSASKQHFIIKPSGENKNTKNLVSKSIKIENDNSIKNSTIAKDNPLNLINKNEISNQRVSLSKIKTPASKELVNTIASSKNAKLKEDLIQKALNDVPMSQYFDHDTHKKNLKRSYKMRFFRNLSLAGFILLFGGYLFFLNIPSISFRVAAVQSGLSKTATLPNYKPAGYSFKSRAAYGPGYVKIEMKNNNGNKLELSQEKSSFDSEALKDNIVSRIDGGYSTYVKDGLTIYLYNKGGASWVNKGQVYSLNGDTSDLSSDEILNMAASM